MRVMLAGFVALMLAVATQPVAAKQRGGGQQEAGSCPNGSFEACVNARMKNADAAKLCRRRC